MLQNINFNGLNINGIQSNNSVCTVAAGCDLSVKRIDLGKPLSKPSVPHVIFRHYPTVTPVRRSRQVHQLMQREMWQQAKGTVAMPAVLEPPAAAWASFVIARSTSV